jgi:hypothetical protein
VRSGSIARRQTGAGTAAPPSTAIRVAVEKCSRSRSRPPAIAIVGYSSSGCANSSIATISSIAARAVTTEA